MAKKKIISFLAVFISIVVLDLIFISTLILPIYQDSVSSTLKATPSITSSLLAWLLITLGIIYFVNPNSKNKKQSFKKGALFGLIVYGVYSLTNYAIIQNWTIKMAIIDIIWGMILCGTLSVINKAISK
ncbi:MAG: DUF2177 family protein [Candidatus Pacearchaeota archaeon]